MLTGSRIVSLLQLLPPAISLSRITVHQFAHRALQSA